MTSESYQQLRFWISLIDRDELEDVHHNLAFLPTDELSVVSEHFDETVVGVSHRVHIDLDASCQFDRLWPEGSQAEALAQKIDHRPAAPRAERHRHASIGQDSISWNYTTWLTIVFLLLAAALVWRFLRTGGREMLAMMGGGPDDMTYHDHASSQDGDGPGPAACHDHAGDHSSTAHPEP